MPYELSQDQEQVRDVTDLPTPKPKPGDQTQPAKPGDKQAPPSSAQLETTPRVGQQQQPHDTKPDTSQPHLPGGVQVANPFAQPAPGDQQQTKPLSPEDLAKRQQQLNDTLNADKPDGDKIQNLLTGVPKDQREQITGDPDKFKQKLDDKFKNDDDDQRLAKAKILNVVNKPDNGPNLAGDINVFLNGKDKGQVNAQLVNYLGSLSPEQAKTAADQYQAQFGVSLKDALTKDGDKEKNFGNKLDQSVKDNLDLLLKGSGPNGRTADDNVKLARAGAAAGHGTGMNLLAVALTGDTDAAKGARAQLANDSSFKSDLDKNWKDNDRSMIDDFLQNGSSLRFILSQKDTTKPADVQQALQTATQADRDQFQKVSCWRLRTSLTVNSHLKKRKQKTFIRMSTAN